MLEHADNGLQLFVESSLVASQMRKRRDFMESMELVALGGVTSLEPSNASHAPRVYRFRRQRNFFHIQHPHPSNTMTPLDRLLNVRVGLLGMLRVLGDARAVGSLAREERALVDMEAVITADKMMRTVEEEDQGRFALFLEWLRESRDELRSVLEPLPPTLREALRIVLLADSSVYAIARRHVKAVVEDGVLEQALGTSGLVVDQRLAYPGVPAEFCKPLSWWLQDLKQFYADKFDAARKSTYKISRLLATRLVHHRLGTFCDVCLACLVIVCLCSVCLSGWLHVKRFGISRQQRFGKEE